MSLSEKHEYQLLIRLRFIGALLFSFGCLFFCYYFFSENSSILSPPDDPVEESGISLSSLNELAYMPNTVSRIFTIGSSLFCVIGLGIVLYALHKLKYHSHRPSDHE